MRCLFALLLTTIASAQTAGSLKYTAAVLAGSDWVGDNGPATQALLFQAEGLATDLSGNIYIADAQGHRVRQVSPAGVIRTIAGTGQPGFSGDGGPAGSAQLNAPYGLPFDNRGNLYIADLGNARVRRVNFGWDCFYGWSRAVEWTRINALCANDQFPLVVFCIHRRHLNQIYTRSAAIFPCQTKQVSAETAFQKEKGI